MIGHFCDSVEGAHRGRFLDGIPAFVELAGLFVQNAGRINTEMFGHERIHCLTLGVFVSMIFVSEVCIFHLGLCVVVFVDGPDVWILDLWRVFRPVSSDGDKFEWARYSQSCELSVVRLKFGRLMNRHSAFTIAAAEKVRRYHHHGYTDQYAFIHHR